MALSHPFASPTTAIGDYIVSHEIGRGSFATVYMGKAISTGRPVAVKSVSRDKLNRKLAENLESEIKILKGIQHDHVVALLDIVSTEKHIHLIMEYCSLGDLSQYIKRKGLVAGFTGDAGAWNPLSGPWGGLNEIVVRHFLRQLASAMEFLRAHNLIHRDLKPQNVLLCPPPADGPNINIPSPSHPGTLANVPALPVLKLADFGFARALPSHSLASTLCGSPLYMAPEILRGDKYGPSADLWSFGAILYEMICGRPPFKAQNYIDLLRKIERGEGTIRFPGEDMSSVTARRNSALSSSPSARYGLSPSSGSPRFPAMMKGVPPIGDDLKDLIRRLLKRNPQERMSFEAFFLHPCVISNRGIGTTPVGSYNSMDEHGNPLRRKSSTSSQRSIKYGSTPPQGDLPFAHQTATVVGTAADLSKTVAAAKPAYLPAPPLARVHTSPARPGFQRGETLVLGMPHDAGFHHRDDYTTVTTSGVSGSSAPQNPEHLMKYVSSGSSAVGYPADMARQSSAPVIYHTGSSSGTGGSGHSSFAPSIRTGQLHPTRVASIIMEESGSGIGGITKSRTTADLAVEPPFPGYGDVNPAIFAGVVATTTLNYSDAAGALSQTDHANDKGSEAEDEEEDNGKAAEENNSSLSSLGSLELSEGDDPDDVLSTDAATSSNAPVAATTTAHTRSFTTTGGSGGSGGGRASLEEYVVVEKRVVEVNWLADQVADAVGTHHAGEDAFIAPGLHYQQQQPQETNTWWQTDATITTTTPQAGASATPSTSPRPLRVSPKQRSRIFGSLRESTHQFLNPAPTPTAATTTAGGASATAIPQLSSTASSSSSPSSNSNPHLGTTPPAAYIAAASSPIRVVGDTGRLPSLGDSHPLLAPLNLCALRGHAVQQLADSIRPVNAHEALGCYLLALRCYQTGMEVAKGIWSSVRAASSGGGASMIGGGNVGSSMGIFAGAASALLSAAQLQQPADNARSPPPLSSPPGVDLRILSVGVQWVRERFNECLDAAERCEHEGDAANDDAPRSPPPPPPQGKKKSRRVEMVVYEGALEVSRRAAVLELSVVPPSAAQAQHPPASTLTGAPTSSAQTSSSPSSAATANATPAPQQQQQQQQISQQLQVCEDLYRHAILLIEALLTLDGDDADLEHHDQALLHDDEDDDDSYNEANVHDGAGGGGRRSTAMTDEDRRVLERFVASLWGRVGAVSTIPPH
ncbi:Serine/threonine-protein kinase [Geranomyces michiganensis]|nr:Serine/threonine-protein kinase [Geranomyces michiganensis]